MQKGFTLVELAIVMTIIGLLIGGILKGQELVNNARITSTIAQVKGVEAAVSTFRDTYNGVPGDISGASTRIPGCNANCNPPLFTGGDGIVGAINWESAGYLPQLPAAGMPNPATAIGDETELFWIHLFKANLITGLTSDSLTSVVTPQWGVTHPAAKIDGGFVVGYGDGSVPLNSPQTNGTGVAGTVLVLQKAPNTRPTATVDGSMPLTPGYAAQIDRKLDDGNPSTGYVQAYGKQTSCFMPFGATYTYNESVTQKDCGLFLRIQG
ncbi:MAG: prepilin-type N-terminal cleavage/methylation domain-containing protein [Micavibrio sp.]|nr:prepilin-type N-terminal cleavage/methylation domain-containing protein [Micavibrio sp.]